MAGYNLKREKEFVWQQLFFWFADVGVCFWPFSAASPAHQAWHFWQSLYHRLILDVGSYKFVVLHGPPCYMPLDILSEVTVADGVATVGVPYSILRSPEVASLGCFLHPEATDV